MVYRRLQSTFLALFVLVLLVQGCGPGGGGGGYTSYAGYQTDRQKDFAGAQMEPGANEMYNGTAGQWMIWRFPDGTVKQDLVVPNGSGGVFIAKTQTPDLGPAPR